MALPTARDYQEALQHPSDHFSDPELRSSTAECNRLGLPVAISGNFASVFKVVTPSGTRYAVRCFVRYFEDEHERYDAIGAFLDGVDASWKVAFSFIDEGIRIGGQWFPILKMQWIDAQPINRYIASHLANAPTILALASEFLRVVTDLHRRGAAHGDLQHGNLLVTADGAIKLIDYDGMYVPALAGKGGHEIGNRNYQHPDRSEADFGPAVDNFSAWVIYVSLLAVAIDPNLWNLLDAGEEKMLFAYEDYISPALGLGLRTLGFSSNPDLARLTALIKENIASFRSGVSDLEEIEVATGGASASELPAVPASGPGGAHPEWMQSHVPIPAPISMSPAAWLRPTMAVTIAGAIALLALGISGLLPLLVSGVADVLLVGALAAAIGIALVRTVEFAERRVRSQKRTSARKRRNEAQREVSAAEKRVAGIVKDAKRLEVDNERASAKRAKQRETEIQRIQQARQSRQAGIAKRRNDLNASQAREIAKALEPIRASMYRTQMATYRIADNRIPGIGPALSTALAMHGIATAADFSGTSRLLNVRGIGPTKAQTLEAWRQSVVAQVNRRLPTSLSPADQRAIEARYQGRLQALVVEERQAHEEGEREIAAANARHQVEEAKAIADARQAAAELEARRHEAEATLQQRRTGLADDEVLVRQAEREMMPYRNMTYKRFVVGIARGQKETT